MSLRVAKVEGAGAGVGDHRPDRQVLGRREDLTVDHERLLPQHRGVEGPAVAEAVAFGALHQADDARGRRVGLQDESEVHGRRS
jgi:hypothetical protein